MAGGVSATRAEVGRGYRWLALAVVSLAMFGNYYLYDALAPASILLRQDLGFTDEQYGVLFTAYNAGALLALLVAGPVIDRIGPRRAILLFGAVSTAAGFLTVLSPGAPAMQASRFVLGVGSEPLIVAITAALARWFRGKELSFAFAVNLLVARLGSVAADNSPTWAGRLFTSWRPPLWLGAAIGVGCVAGGALNWLLETRAERRFTLPASGSTDRLLLRDLVGFDRSYWYAVGLCLTFYSAIFPFRAFAFRFFTEGRGTTLATAGFLNSLLNTMAMVGTPLFGLLVDRAGRRAFLMVAGSALLLPVYLLLAYGGLPPHVPMALMGIAFSLIPAVLWPSVAYIVEERRLGTAYALMTLLQQVGWGAVNWLVGKSNDLWGAGPQNPAGYRPGMWIFTGLALVGLWLSVLLWRFERGPRAHGLETITTRSGPGSP